MPESLADLEQQRRTIFQRMTELPDFRSGSITATYGTCGKTELPLPAAQPIPAWPELPPHPQSERKTVKETFATTAELQKAQREVTAYQHFRQLSQELIALNESVALAKSWKGNWRYRKKQQKHPSRRSAGK